MAQCNSTTKTPSSDDRVSGFRFEGVQVHHEHKKVSYRYKIAWLSNMRSICARVHTKHIFDFFFIWYSWVRRTFDASKRSSWRWALWQCLRWAIWQWCTKRLLTHILNSDSGRHDNSQTPRSATCPSCCIDALATSDNICSLPIIHTLTYI